MSHKPDSQKILDHMSELAKALSSDTTRAWWPKYLFRFDHVENAARILNSGRVLSRKQASLSGVISHDSAAQSYVKMLEPNLRDYVRLYFRPRTPTQYNNEGIRPNRMILRGAHMPVPIFLLFSNQVLTLEGVRFSKGRLVSDASIGSSFEFLKELNFVNIYHNTYVDPLGSGSSTRSEILNARHSEILIKRELDLRYLKHILCRSTPEQQTLINLLEPPTLDKWRDRIRVAPNHIRLFNKLGTFVEECELESTHVRLKFYDNVRSDSWRGPFDLGITCQCGSEQVLNRTRNDFFVSSNRPIFEFREWLDDYCVQIRLNDDLAYSSQFQAREYLDDPF